MYYGTLCSGIILLMCNYEWKNILLWRNYYLYTRNFILLWKNFNIFNNFIAGCFFLFCDGTTPSQKTENFNIFIDFVTGFSFCDSTKLSQKIEILLYFNTFCDDSILSQK